jgi:UDP-3-O-[3-hydroxymyristoyl] glucosamine N-acyltransferase
MEREALKSYTNDERLAYARSKKSERPADIISVTAKIDKTAVIGNDGFGYAREHHGALLKMPHTGNVVICDWVEIGAHTCIDRAVEGSTVIGEGTKIDNLVHIAHGVKIGKNCLIVAGSVIGGSCEIGDHVYIGIGAMIKNKVRIGNNVTIGMGAVVLKDVPDGVTVVGNPARVL